MIELMIVVAVIGILAAIAVPKFAELVRKSREGSTKGQLGALRSALSIYYSDMEGLYPFDLRSLTANGKYLTAIPKARAPNYHPDSSEIVTKGQGVPFQDRGGWRYVNDATDSEFGLLWVNCVHTDTKGSVWSDY